MSRNNTDANNTDANNTDANNTTPPAVMLVARDPFVVVRRAGPAVNVTLDLTRQGGSGPITIAVPSPPPGISTSSVTVEETAGTATISISADATAALGGPVDVKIEGTFAAGTANVVLPAMVFGASGTLDTTFAMQGSTVFPASSGGYSYDYPRALAFQPDGKLVIAGVTTTGGYRFVAVRLTENGTFDPMFAGGAGKVSIPISDVAHAFAVAIDSQGRILLGGGSGINLSLRWTIIRLNADGTPDATFGNQPSLPGVMVISETASSGSEYISALRVLPNGLIFAIGAAAASGHLGLGVVRINDNGTAVDPTFNGGMIRRHTVDPARHVIVETGPPVAVAVDSVGRYAFAGSVSANGSSPSEASFFGRLLETGEQDPRFPLRTVPTTAGTSFIHGVGIGVNDAVILAGEVAPDDLLVIKYTSVGALDGTFNGGQLLKVAGRGAAWDAVSTPAGIVLAGRTLSVAPVDMLVMRLQPSAVPDSTFGTNGVYTAHYSQGGGNADLALRVAADKYGRIVVGGRRVPPGGSAWNFVLFRLFP